MHELLVRIAADLAALHAHDAVVGGPAVSARAEPRFTRELDLAVAVADDREAEAIVGHLVARGYRIVSLIEHEVTGRLATVRLEHASTPGVIVDLLFATAGIEPELVADASQMHEDGLHEELPPRDADGLHDPGDRARTPALDGGPTRVHG